MTNLEFFQEKISLYGPHFNRKCTRVLAHNIKKYTRLKTKTWEKAKRCTDEHVVQTDAPFVGKVTKIQTSPKEERNESDRAHIKHREEQSK